MNTELKALIIGYGVMTSLVLEVLFIWLYLDNALVKSILTLALFLLHSIVLSRVVKSFKK